MQYSHQQINTLGNDLHIQVYKGHCVDNEVVKDPGLCPVGYHDQKNYWTRLSS